jgi:hypothetical protein
MLKNQQLAIALGEQQIYTVWFLPVELTQVIKRAFSEDVCHASEQNRLDRLQLVY